jgi:hypothetical protein
MDIAAPRLKEFHTQKAAIETTIAEAPEDENIVGLHRLRFASTGVMSSSFKALSLTV